MFYEVCPCDQFVQFSLDTHTHATVVRNHDNNYITL